MPKNVYESNNRVVPQNGPRSLIRNLFRKSGSLKPNKQAITNSASTSSTANQRTVALSSNPSTISERFTSSSHYSSGNNKYSTAHVPNSNNPPQPHFSAPGQRNAPPFEHAANSNWQASERLAPEDNSNTQTIKSGQENVSSDGNGQPTASDAQQPDASGASKKSDRPIPSPRQKKRNPELTDGIHQVDRRLKARSERTVTEFLEEGNRQQLAEPPQNNNSASSPSKDNTAPTDSSQEAPKPLPLKTRGTIDDSPYPDNADTPREYPTPIKNKEKSATSRKNFEEALRKKIPDYTKYIKEPSEELSKEFSKKFAENMTLSKMEAMIKIINKSLKPKGFHLKRLFSEYVDIPDYLGLCKHPKGAGKKGKSMQEEIAYARLANSIYHKLEKSELARTEKNRDIFCRLIIKMEPEDLDKMTKILEALEKKKNLKNEGNLSPSNAPNLTSEEVLDTTIASSQHDSIIHEKTEQTNSVDNSSSLNPTVKCEPSEVDLVSAQQNHAPSQPEQPDSASQKNLKRNIALASAGMIGSFLGFIGGFALTYLLPPVGIIIMVGSSGGFFVSLYKFLSNNSKLNDFIIKRELNEKIVPALETAITKKLANNQKENPLGYQLSQNLTLREGKLVIQILKNGLDRHELHTNFTFKNKIKSIFGFHFVEILPSYGSNSDANDKERQKLDEMGRLLACVVGQQLANAKEEPTTEKQLAQLAHRLTVNEINKLTEIFERGTARANKFGGDNLILTPRQVSTEEALTA